MTTGRAHENASDAADTAWDGQDRLDQALKTNFGYTSFRAGQREIIEQVLAGRDACAILPTGGGKSLVYQLPALLLPGLTLVISPLIALMHDQVNRLTADGIAATFLTSTLSPEERAQREADVLKGRYRLLYVSPERFASPAFRSLLAAVRARQGVALLAVDEAHCISEWGHDYRPDYRLLGEARALLPGVPLLALTATATERVRRDIVEQLQLQRAYMHIASFNRPNLSYEVSERGRDVYADLRGRIRRLHADDPTTSIIVYCQSRRAVDALAERLTGDGVVAVPYHAGLSPEERAANQEAFVTDHAPVLVGTIAFGMGVHKPDVRLVVHMEAPRSLEALYQESGRAGRDGDPAHCLLYFAPGDRAKVEFFIAQMSESAQQAIAREQYQQVVAYAMGSGCRRRALLAYFGEIYEAPNCGACDRCLQPQVLEDHTTEAQMLLSAVARTGQRFGLTHVVNVLRGSGAQRIAELGHDRLSVFGIGQGQSVEFWQHLAQHLVIEQALVEQTDAQRGFRTLQLGPVADEVLRRGRRIEISQPAVRVRGRRDDARAGRGGTLPGVQPSELTSADDIALFHLLRARRRELAEERNVPPYVVFHDAALREMVARRPATLEHFSQIAGVGRQKAEAYCEPFTSVIRIYCDDHALPLWPEGTQRRQPESAVPSYARRNATGASSERSERAERTQARTAEVTLALVREGQSLEEVARERGLALSTVVGHLCEQIEAGAATDIPLEQLVPAEHIAPITQAFAQAESDALAPIKERLGDEYPYSELHVVRAYLRSTWATTITQTQG